MRSYRYRTSPNDQRWVGVNLQRARDVWSTLLFDMAHGVGEKRGGQIAVSRDGDGSPARACSVAAR